MNRINCPGCGTGYQLDAGEMVVCQICQRELRASGKPAPQPTPVADDAPLLEAADEPESIPTAAPVSPSPSAPTPRAALPTAKPLSPPAQPPTRPAPASPAIPAATPRASVPAVASAATPTPVSHVAQAPPPAPPANPVPATGNYQPHHEYERRRRSPLVVGMLMLAMLLLCSIGIVLLAGVLSGKWDLRLELPVADSTDKNEGVTEVDSGDVVDQLSETDTWTNAAEKAIRIGQVKVKVVRAEWGTARGKDENNAVIETPDEYLQVSLRVENQKSSGIVYRSWYTQGSDRVHLRDDRGKSYSLVRFADVKKVRWHVDEEPLESRESIDDILIFQVPGDRASIKHFELELSPEATGTDWGYRFLLPRSMIQDF